MRCKKCDYPLWTIAARSCPECGEPFTPSDFEFRRGAVKYCCPHCRQEYYGTSARGHLEPREFDCVRCGQHITMDEMVLEPADAGALDSAAMATGKTNPWFARDGRNVVTAWLRGTGMLLSTPGDFGATLPATAPMGTAILFCAIGTAILCVASLLCALPMYGFMFAGAGGGPGAGQIVSLLVWSGLQPIVIALVLVPLSACIAHAILLISGGTEHGFGRTMQAVLYTEGATALLSIIPCVGYLSRIWWAVMLVFLLMRMQRVSGVRATFAAIPPVLLPILIVVLFFLLPVFAMGGLAATPGGMPAMTSPVQEHGGTLASDLAQEALFNDYVWAATPLDSVADGNASGESLLGVVAPDGTSLGIGSAMQSDILFGASNDNVRAAAKELAAKLPPNNQPFRIGSAVFTYRGIPESAFDSGLIGQLWLVVVVPTDPTQPIETFSTMESAIYPPGTFDAALKEQNRVRSLAGLPALTSLQTLPDLRGVQ